VPTIAYANLKLFACCGSESDNSKLFTEVQ